MFYFLLKTLCSPIFKLIWVKSIQGIENIPKSGPVILASNHESYFDFFIIAITCPRRVYFMAGGIFF
jgi:1-acyl-sn-glycerol-3-phosphate acyltransferase